MTDGGADRRAARWRATAAFFRRLFLLSLVVNVVLTAAIVRGCLARNTARAIYVDGKLTCLVRSDRAARQVHDALLAAKKGSFRGPAAFKQKWEDKDEPAKGEEVYTVQQAVAMLKPLLDVVVQGYAVQVEGSDIVVMPTKELAEEVLRTVKARFLAEGETLISPQTFEREPAIVPTEVLPDLLVEDIRTATETLLKGTTEPEEYVVKAGDTPSSVAGAHGMTVEQLYTLNPELRAQARRNDVHPGDRWKRAGRRPRLVVITKKETVRTVPIPFKVIEEARETLPAGKVVVSRVGRAGERKEWIRATWRNDKLVADSVRRVKQQRIREPEDKVVFKGVRPTVPEPRVPNP